MSKVSVLLPVYNCEEFLGEAIQSILDQSFNDFEFIIIDDCSTDKSLEVMKTFKDERIKVIENQQNLGLIAALNIGINHSKGKYIARMDQDDISLLDRLQKQVAFLDNNSDIDVVGTSFEVFGKKSYIIEHPQKNGDIKANLLFNNSFCHPSVMFRKKTVEEHNLRYDKNFKHTEDYAFWTQSANKLNYANIKEILLHWRWHNHDEAYEKNSAQAINCKNIRINYLKKMGLKLTSEEIDLHEQIATNNFENNWQNQLKLIDWFSKIYSASKECKFLDEEAVLNKLFSIMSPYFVKENKLDKQVVKKFVSTPFYKKLKFKNRIKLSLTGKFRA